MHFQARLVFTIYDEFCEGFLELLISIFAVTLCLWVIYLPLAWLGEERLFLSLMRKDGKGRYYWTKFFPAFLKRELKAAFTLFIFLTFIAFIESIVSTA